MNLSFEREIRPRLERKDLPFKLTLVVNAAPDSLAVKAQTRAGDSWTETALNEVWPKDVFSLSHIAVPISPTDPVYGTAEATAKSGLPLGSLTVRGEHGALMISDSHAHPAAAQSVLPVHGRPRRKMAGGERDATMTERSTARYQS